MRAIDFANVHLNEKYFLIDLLANGNRQVEIVQICIPFSFHHFSSDTTSLSSLAFISDSHQPISIRLQFRFYGNFVEKAKRNASRATFYFLPFRSTPPTYKHDFSTFKLVLPHLQELHFTNPIRHSDGFRCLMIYEKILIILSTNVSYNVFIAYTRAASIWPVSKFHCEIQSL